MKKGAMTLGTLVRMTPNILVILILLGIFAMLFVAIMTEEKTPTDRDFDRILAEFEDIQRPEIGKEQATITIPVQATETYHVVLYKQGDPNLPTQCRDDSCVCLYKKKGVVYEEECKRYKNIGACTEECGPDLCIAETMTTVPAGRNQITITRDCNKLTVT